MSKKLFIVIGFISAILSVIFAVTPLVNLAVVPILIAFLSGLIVHFISKKQNTKTKAIQYIFLLVIISLSLTLYKSMFSSEEFDNTQQLEIRDDENLDDSKNLLKDKNIDKAI